MTSIDSVISWRRSKIIVTCVVKILSERVEASAAMPAVHLLAHEHRAER
jgi:hypothetical protein